LWQLSPLLAVLVFVSLWLFSGHWELLKTWAAYRPNDQADNSQNEPRRDVSRYLGAPKKKFPGFIWFIDSSSFADSSLPVCQIRARKFGAGRAVGSTFVLWQQSHDNDEMDPKYEVAYGDRKSAG
jgi:hypothetical protein